MLLKSILDSKKVGILEIRLSRGNQNNHHAEMRDEALNEIDVIVGVEVEEVLPHGYENSSQLSALYDYGYSLCRNNGNGEYGPDLLCDTIEKISSQTIQYGPANKLPPETLRTWELINDGITSLLKGPSEIVINDGTTSFLQSITEKYNITTSDIVSVNNATLHEVSMIDIATPVADIVDLTAASILLGTAALFVAKGATPALLNDTISNVYSNMRSILEVNNFYNTNIVPNVFKATENGCFINTRRITVRLYENYMPQDAVEAEFIGLAFRGDYIHYKWLINNGLEVSYLTYRKMLALEFGFIQNYPTLFDYDFALTIQLSADYTSAEISDGTTALFLEHQSITEVHNALELLATTGLL